MNAICENTETRAKKESKCDPIPCALDDLMGRLATVRAVTRSLPDTIDSICTEDFKGSDEERRYRLTQIIGLADAILVLFDLAEDDATRLLRELESRNY